MYKPVDIFKLYQAQTFSSPSCLEIISANGNYIKDVKGKEYLDCLHNQLSLTVYPIFFASS